MADMGRCRDCKHYERSWMPPDAIILGECRLLGNGGEASTIAFTDYDMLVAPSFGCVQFEKREDSNGD